MENMSSKVVYYYPLSVPLVTRPPDRFNISCHMNSLPVFVLCVLKTYALLTAHQQNIRLSLKCSFSCL